MGHALWRDLLSPSETRKEARLSSSEAFKQENPCDETNNTKEDIKNNRMNVEIHLKVDPFIEGAIIIPKDKKGRPYIKL